MALLPSSWHAEGSVFMPIKIPNNLPAAHILEGENIFVMDCFT